MFNTVRDVKVVKGEVLARRAAVLSEINDYIIDLQQTVVLFQTAYNFVVETALAAGGDLICGDQRSSRRNRSAEGERAGYPM